MLAADRRNHILGRVAEEQSLHITQLALELGVSEMTVRRDIARLERQGFLRRTYGGATAHLTRSLDLGINPRTLENAQAKRLIGVAAARLLTDAATMFVGVGTPTEQFARFLPARAELTVITESLPIATLLGTRPMRVVVLGGALLTDELACVGAAALATLARYRTDAAVVGAAGFSARYGLTELTEEEAENHRVMMERSDRVVVLADGSKLGAKTMAQVAPATSVSLLITDESAPAREVKALRDAGVDVLIAARSSRDGQAQVRGAPTDGH
jgi:DeoR family transcriptional regulator, aga operon transcriptional repressor